MEQKHENPQKETQTKTKHEHSATRRHKLKHKYKALSQKTQTRIKHKLPVNTNHDNPADWKQNKSHSQETQIKTKNENSAAWRDTHIHNYWSGLNAPMRTNNNSQLKLSYMVSVQFYMETRFTIHSDKILVLL